MMEPNRIRRSLVGFCPEKLSYYYGFFVWWMPLSLEWITGIIPLFHSPSHNSEWTVSPLIGYKFGFPQCNSILLAARTCSALINRFSVALAERFTSRNVNDFWGAGGSWSKNPIIGENTEDCFLLMGHLLFRLPWGTVKGTKFWNVKVGKMCIWSSYWEWTKSQSGRRYIQGADWNQRELQQAAHFTIPSKLCHSAAVFCLKWQWRSSGG